MTSHYVSGGHKHPRGTSASWSFISRISTPKTEKSSAESAAAAALLPLVICGSFVSSA